MDRIFVVVGALMASLAVGSGAWGAHGLEAFLQSRFDPERASKLLDTWDTAVRYHMYHALALLGVAWICSRWPSTLSSVSGWCLLAGTLVFSGTLYAICLTGIGWLGRITPIGGLALMLGWIMMAWAVWRAD